MKKIAIMFPGIGYGLDRPLMYYSRKLLEKYGYETFSVNYDSIDVETVKYCVRNRKLVDEKKFHSTILGFIAEAIKETERQLSKVSLTDCESVVMVGKSIGTVVGTAFLKKNNIKAINVLITPIEQCFQFVGDEGGIAFVGEKDPIADVEAVKRECHKKDVELHCFSDSNHSLETGNVEEDIRSLSMFASLLDDYVDTYYKSVYEFEVEGRKNELLSLSEYAGMVSLVVNTATGCGFTPQYEKLEKMYEDYHKKGFTILDFPCNQFNNQAPGSSEQIHSFCTARYNVSFPQFAKIRVNGEDATELYKYLKNKRGFKGFNLNTPEGRFLDRMVRENDPTYEKNNEIKWNFTKFLVSREGKVLKRYEPLDDLEMIRKDVEMLL